MTTKEFQVMLFNLVFMLAVNFGLPFRVWKISGALIDYELPY